jgi:hypothetical protein
MATISRYPPLIVYEARLLPIPILAFGGAFGLFFAARKLAEHPVIGLLIGIPIFLLPIVMSYLIWEYRPVLQLANYYVTLETFLENCDPEEEWWARLAKMLPKRPPPEYILVPRWVSLWIFVSLYRCLAFLKWSLGYASRVRL